MEHLKVASTFWSRFAGLQLQRQLADGCGLLLVPCTSIHTCFMRFPIDVIMLDAGYCVVGIRKNVRPWRMVFCEKGTRQILETAVDATDLSVGLQVRVE